MVGSFSGEEFHELCIRRTTETGRDHGPFNFAVQSFTRLSVKGYSVQTYSNRLRLARK